MKPKSEIQCNKENSSKNERKHCFWRINERSFLYS